MRTQKSSVVVALSLVVAAVGSMFVAPSARAVVLADQWYRNKSAPTGTFANSGWQYEGKFGDFLGTAIGKNYFMTASHIGGNVGSTFVLNGVSYPTVAMYDDPVTDLRIWKTSKSFSKWAPLYTTLNETNKTAVVIGRGTARGADVKVGSTLKGWQWGANDHIESWGRNHVKGIVNGGSGIGDVISFAFDRNGHGDHVQYEGAPSEGDSSGGVFVNVSGTWRLAGIVYSAENPFKTSAGGTPFSADIFDKGGLYYNNSFVSDSSTDIPALWYATRIGSRASWINSVLNGSAAASASALPRATVPEPTSGAIVLAASALLSLRRRRH